MGIELADSINSKEKPLSHLRVAFTAIDLEQAEHRGIAYLSKALISSLSDLGAEVYLITGFYGQRLNPLMKSSMSAQSVREVDCADILDQFCDPKNRMNKIKRESDFEEDLITKFVNKCIKLKSGSRQTIKLLFSVLRFYICRGKFSGRLINLYNYENSPYFGQERVSYLSKISGFLSIRDIYHLCTLRSKRLLPKSPSIDLRKSKIDLLITSCPLSIDVIRNTKKNSSILQIIMDFIPLSFSKHPDHPFDFYNRLKDAMRTKSCFISKTSRDKVCLLLEKSHSFDYQNIIYPLPSLNIDKLNLASKVKNLRGLKNKFILFNSSVVPRKNLHFLINIFKNSELASQDFDLCIAGKLHDDQYGDDIKKMCEGDASIKLLDYVDENEKAWLFLNAYAFVSPSCVEGFGIPVLDAAALGLRVIASDIPSHKEIADLVDANQSFQLLDLSNIDKWIYEFNLLNTLDLCMEEEIKFRISKFQSCFKFLKDGFDKTIVDLLL
ncbi:glycosyltransferase [Prochlorococcus marinus]|uniref:glycosyltransferase n=1 Tax=Prochlorococcus marinus TaxID=1219 RepID=UPI0022B3C146|nr:glycosyltransferase [Prochlorococcus marinus]